MNETIHYTKPFSLLTEYDIYLFKEGKHFNLYEKLGSHFVINNKSKGVYFAVYAPNACYVSVIADFNFWNHNTSPLFQRHDGSGIWEGFIEHVNEGNKYKYYITNNNTKESFEKIDPFAYFFEEPPKTASIIKSLDNIKWNDAKWLKNRKNKNLNSPISVYEVHLGSWRHIVNEDGSTRVLTYKELSKNLVDYVKEMEYTHVEFMPITEHPYFLSWGYQTLGYFAPTSRYGDLEDFAFLVNEFHKNDIGVFLDFVPSHFPCDQHGLYKFDGSSVFEYSDPLKQIHPDWKSAIFDFGKPEVRSFLISATFFWLEKYHIDGLRIDAVASMLYLDYSRKENEWQTNIYGGNENLEAIEFLKNLNEAIFFKFPDVHMIAEESTAWKGVSHPVYTGGLGFNMKWMMGWMHDTLNYLQKDSIHRKYVHHDLLFSFLYFTNENFMLPLSHDEVVHGKGSLINKMTGDYWQKFANLRLLYSYLFFHPGTKLSFMGNEIAQFEEWNVNKSLDWHLLENLGHKGIQILIKDLNVLYKKEKSLFINQFSNESLEWIANDDYQQSIIALIRKAENEEIIIIGNFTPEVRQNYRIGVNKPGNYKEIFNSDLDKYFGSNLYNAKIVTQNNSFHGRQYSIVLQLPPLSFIVLKQSKK